ncbi:MAG: NlpC/P60 family protein [Enterocloster clostridioformis]
MLQNSAGISSETALPADKPSVELPSALTETQPGDLIFYGSGRSINHVAMYIGNGQIVRCFNGEDRHYRVQLGLQESGEDSGCA